MKGKTTLWLKNLNLTNLGFYSVCLHPPFQPRHSSTSHSPQILLRPKKMLQCEEKGIYGPGHNSFTKDENGNDIMVYHARTESKIEGDPLYNPKADSPCAVDIIISRCLVLIDCRIMGQPKAKRRIRPLFRLAPQNRLWRL